MPNIHAVDFGTGEALVIHGPQGPVAKSSLQLPRIAGGKTPRDEFGLILTALLAIGDVVVESPTIGSSGAEVGDIIDIVAGSSNVLYTISARAVKNWRMDRHIDTPKSYAKYETVSDFTQPEAHILDAEILYRIATEEPYRLREWHLAERLDREHKSVRPMDKRGYRDDRAIEFMARLPAFSTLPDELQQSPIGLRGNYRRPLAIPFAMALTEPALLEVAPEERRKRFLKIVGAYEHGYPSFYRRMFIVWMQINAKMMAGATRMGEVAVDVRKAALRLTQKQIRHLYHLSAR